MPSLESNQNAQYGCTKVNGIKHTQVCFSVLVSARQNSSCVIRVRCCRRSGKDTVGYTGLVSLRHWLSSFLPSKQETETCQSEIIQTTPGGNQKKPTLYFSLIFNLKRRTEQKSSSPFCLGWSPHSTCSAWQPCWDCFTCSVLQESGMILNGYTCKEAVRKCH